MIYNMTRQLDEKMFKSPDSSYRSLPFWAWNGKLEPEKLKRQIEYFKEMGFGGFFMHPRNGLDTEYLGEEFMKCVSECIDKAESTGMNPWLYDEDRYPSGSAGGLVTENPEYRGVFMLVTPTPRSDVVSVEEGIKKHKTYLLGTYDVVLNEDSEIIEYSTYSGKEPKGRIYYAYCVPADDSAWYNGKPYVNALSKEAIKEFVKVTHERYKKTLGEKLKSVPGIFTDEPYSIMPTWYYNRWPFNGDMETDMVSYWTHDFPEQFLADSGLDLLPLIPEIVWTREDGNAFVKYKFMDMVAQRFATGFFGEIAKWCRENNILLTGHLVREEDLCRQSSSSGEIMRPMSKMDIPGIDLLYNGVELTTLKEGQSVKNQYGKNAMLTELYGISNWDFDFRNYKYQGDWQAALGATLRVPHLSMYTMEGEGKRDYPASIGYQSPWYKDFAYVEDHFARLATVLTRGKPVVRVAVLHPIESYWLYLGPSENARRGRERTDSMFKNITQWLLEGHIDFDYIAESLIPELWNKNDNLVGAMKYDAIVLAGITTLRDSTLKMLSEFAENGGRVIIAGDSPSMINSIKGDAILPYALEVSAEKECVLEALEENRILTINEWQRALVTKGVPAAEYLYNLREDNDCLWLFIASKAKMACPDVDEEKDIVITIKGEYVPSLYNTVNGEIEGLQFKHENGETKIYKTLHSQESILIRLGKKEEKSIAINSILFRTDDKITFDRQVEYKRQEPNVLILDRAEYKIDDGDYNREEEALSISEKLYKEFSWPAPGMYKVQPWVVRDDDVHTITLSYTVQSEMIVTNAHLAGEYLDKAKINVNGKELTLDFDGYFADEDIRKVKIPELVKGENVIVVQKPFTKKHHAEWMYITGDFDVYVRGCEKTIVPASQKIGFSSVACQGLPFYGGNITYITYVTTARCNARIKCTMYRGAAVKVYVDGEYQGIIAQAPYYIDVRGLCSGSHKVEFVLLGNRYNSFGDLHNADGRQTWCNPIAWWNREDLWADEYLLRDFGILKSPVIEIEKL